MGDFNLNRLAEGAGVSARFSDLTRQREDGASRAPSNEVKDSFISGAEIGRLAGSFAIGLGSGLSFAVMGAFVGTMICPGLGSVAGSIIGGFLGGAVGDLVQQRIYNEYGEINWAGVFVSGAIGMMGGGSGALVGAVTKGTIKISSGISAKAVMGAAGFISASSRGPVRAFVQRATINVSQDILYTGASNLFAKDGKTRQALFDPLRLLFVAGMGEGVFRGVGLAGRGAASFAKFKASFTKTIAKAGETYHAVRLSADPHYPVIIVSDVGSFRQGLARISRFDNRRDFPRAKLVVVKLPDGKTEIRMVRVETAHPEAVLPGEEVVWRGEVTFNRLEGMRFSDGRSITSTATVPECIRAKIGDVNGAAPSGEVQAENPVPVNEEKSPAPPAAEAEAPPVIKGAPVETFWEIDSVDAALRLATRAHNMFVIVRMEDGSVVMRAGAGYHAPMRATGGQVDLAGGEYGVTGGKVILRVTDIYAKGVSSTEIDRLVRARVFADDVSILWNRDSGDLVVVEFKAPLPAAPTVEERLRILRTANGNDYTYIPNNRDELFGASGVIEKLPNVADIKAVIVEMADGTLELRIASNNWTHRSLVLLGEKMVWSGLIIGYPENNILSFTTDPYYSTSTRIKRFLNEKFGE